MKEKLVLSKQFTILIEIYETTELNNQIINFSKLVEKFKKYNYNESFIGCCLEKMYDAGMIDRKWEKIDNFYSYNYYIEEDFLEFVKCLYNAVVIDNENELTR